MAWVDRGKRPGPKPAKPKGRQQCVYEDEEGRCDRNNFGHGLCHAHYMQQRRGVLLRRIRPPRPQAADGFLWCGKCKQFRDECEFGWDTTRDQPKRTCRPCGNQGQLEYVERNREKVNLKRRLSRRGITAEDFENLWSEQEGGCAICSRTDRPLDIDHCHTTGEVRGLLCGPCNRGLGFFDDNIDLLDAAKAYLMTRGLIPYG